ncbi:MAG: ABC transporter substrate-binding protein, partial [Nocardioides sp.]
MAAIGFATALTLVTTGCLQSDDSGSGGDAGGGEDADSSVTILGAFGGVEQEAFEESLAAFEEESGIDVEYTADTDFTTTIVQRVGAGDAPDIGLFPQPGGLLELSEDVTPMDEVIDVAAIEESLIPGFLEASTGEDGTVYGAPMRMAVKSIVWYPKPQYEEAGYSTEPATIQELGDIAEQIAADGTTPWCMGWESDQATGWVGTDWLEEMVLRVNGPEVYDQWVSHEIPFNDPQIV